MARLDRTRRCSARTLLHQLDWRPDHRLVVDVADGTIQIQRHPGRRAPVDTRDTLTLPAAARQLCGISSGDQIVLTADLTHNRMTIYPMAIVARLLTEHHPRPTDDRRGR